MKLTTKIIKNLIREVLSEERAVQYETPKDVALTIADAITYGEEIEETQDALQAAQVFARDHAQESIEGYPKLTYQNVVNKISELLQELELLNNKNNEPT
jgi:vacuolar-type H+-ATPase subunit I/STV1